MSRYCQRTSRPHWHAMLIGLVMGAVLRAAVPPTTAEEPKSTALVASLSLAPAPSLPGLNAGAEPPAPRPLHPLTVTNWPITKPVHNPTDGEAWQTFEAEYRLPNKNPSLIKRQIETVKYGLDTAAFGIDRFVKNVRDRADDTFNSDRPEPTSPGRFWEKPRVKVDLDMTRGKPYIGARLVILFGN